MTSKTQLPKKIFENINQRLRSDEDIDLVRLTNQGHQGIAFKVLVDGQSYLIKRNNKMIEYKSPIFLTQTPQGFKYKNIFLAHKIFKFQNSKDDIEIINNGTNKIKFIEGYKDNIKLTYKRDIDFFMKKNNKNIKYGIGYDIHKFNFLSKKKLKLCGVKIKYFPLESYSDGDVGDDDSQ